MSVWRVWVFPILRLLLIAAIAVALARLAFFPGDDPGEQANEAVPTAELAEPLVSVAVGDVSDDIVLEGSVVRDPAAPVRATIAGQVTQIWVEEGQRVEQGESLGAVRQLVEPDPVAAADSPEDEGGAEAAAPAERVVGLIAPIAGTVESIDAMAEQDLAVGDTAITVSPGSFSVQAQLEPADLYRLQERPESAAVDIVGGPAALECGDIDVAEGDAPAGQGDEAAEPSESAGGGPTLSCSLPGDATVFAGVGASVTLSGRSAEGVLVLPVTAVKGQAERGTVFVPGDGEPAETEVGLGVNDGAMVEITEGLAEGDEVLEYLPIDDPTGGGEDCVDDGAGGMICGDDASADW